MTKNNLVLVRPFWDASQMKFIQPNDALPTDEKLLGRMQELGYLKTQKEVDAQRNPEAAQAQAAADASAEQLQSIYALFPDVTTPDGAVAAIQDLKGRLPSADDLERVSSARTFVQRLGEVFPDARGADQLLAAVKAAQKSAERTPTPEQQAQAGCNAVIADELGKMFPQATTTDALLQAVKDAQSGEAYAGLLTLFAAEDGTPATPAEAFKSAQTLQNRVVTLEALHATPAGTDLPANFTHIGKLKPFGLTTYESLQGKTPEQLDAIEGLTLEQARGIAEKVAAHFAQE